MKFVALAIGIIGILPLALLLKSNAYVRDRFWILLGVLPFVSTVIPFFDVAIITWGDSWLSYVSGLQISLIDLVAVAIYFTIRNNTISIRYHFPFLLYLLAITLSVFQAEQPMAAVFYVGQFIRIYFFAVVITKACADEDIVARLLKGMAIGLAIQVVAVVWQKLGQGVVEPSGTFVHRNTLGLVTHLVVFPHFALFLAGQRQLQYALTPLNGLAVASLIASRAALGFAVFGFIATYLLSVVRRWTGWKVVVAAAGIATAAVMAPMAYSSLQQRFDIDPLIEGYDERAAFNRTALLMLDSNPFGIGVNHYSYVGKTRGYSLRAGVAPVEGSLNNTVHNAFLLAAAEAGYLGFVAFGLLILYPLFIAFRYTVLSDRSDPRGDLLLGLGVALLTVAIHSLFEYIIVIKEVQYVLAIIFGMTFGVAHQVRILRAERRRAERPLGPQRILPANAGRPGR